ncbi:hypothetical protein FRC08_015354 [Ceratobasidium sp. 394]|nr:hypothetical protein FRC08_015354 [Ceratobasidium sp. 394]
MLVALPIVLASGFFKLLALTADITLSQVYTASAVVFYSHRLARTAAESVMPLPMPSYVQEGSGFVPGDLALFAALSPVVTPFEQSSPTFGDCVNVISSSFLSLVRDSLALVSSVPLPGFPAAPTSVTPKFLTLEPPAGAPDPPQIHNVSAHPAFGPHYLDFILVSSLAPVPARFASIPSELGWRSLGSEDAHLVLAGPVRAKPAVVPNTCTPSTPVSCGLGDYHHGSRIASCSPNTNLPVSPKLGMCARASEDAHGISTDSMSNWLGLDSRATGNHNYQHPPTFGLAAEDLNSSVPLLELLLSAGT